MRRILASNVLLLLAVLLLAPAARAAVRGRVPALEPLPATVRAGETVTLRWDAVPEGIEEFEILLSVDGGRSYPLRVTPELDRHERAYHWRVPDLPCDVARLRIRAGERDAEVEGEASAPFRIVGAGARPDDDDAVHESGWWGGPVRLGAGADAGAFGEGAPALRPGGGAALPMCTAPATAAPARSATGLRVPARPAREAVGPSGASAARGLDPLVVPMRN